MLNRSEAWRRGLRQRDYSESPVRKAEWERQLWVGLEEHSVLGGQMKVFSQKRLNRKGRNELKRRNLRNL